MRRRADNRCQHPWCNKLLRENEGHVDHAKRSADGGTDGIGNLQLLCADCHQAKTRAENKGLLDGGWHARSSRPASATGQGDLFD